MHGGSIGGGGIGSIGGGIDGGIGSIGGGIGSDLGGLLARLEIMTASVRPSLLP